MCDRCSLFFCWTRKLFLDSFVVVDVVVAPKRWWLDPFACNFWSRQHAMRPRPDL